MVWIASCRHCGEDVSPRAKACPHCGEPYPAGHAQKFLDDFIASRKRKRKKWLR